MRLYPDFHHLMKVEEVGVGLGLRLSNTGLGPVDRCCNLLANLFRKDRILAMLIELLKAVVCAQRSHLIAGVAV